MLDRLAGVAGAQKLYQQRVRLQPEQLEQPEQLSTSSSYPPDQSMEWRPRAVQRYLKQIDRFLELLYLAVHITGGQPARRPELLSIR